MTPNENNIEEILRRALPSASEEQREAARQRVYNRARLEAHADCENTLDEVSPAGPRRWRSIAMVLAAAAIILAIGIVGFLGTAWRQGAPAVVGSVDGELDRVMDGKTQPLRVNDKVAFGETIRSKGGAGAMVILADGSRIEMRPKSELSLDGLDDSVRIRLSTGGVIVNATKQSAGRHLHVLTKDVSVSVVGTVFLVSAAEAGSRVAVLEGEVKVQQGTETRILLAGEEVATNSLMVPLPVKEEIVWSPQAREYLARLQQATDPTSTPKPSGERVAFEVVSVRPSVSGGGGGRGNAGSPCAGLIQLDPLRFAANNATTYSLIGWAYGKNCLIDSEFLSNGPAWVRSDRFNIEARLPEGTPTYTPAQVRSGNAPKLQTMLQAMLADRFQLVLRGEMKEQPAFVLAAPRGASKLTPWKDGDGESLSLTGQTNQHGEQYARLLGRKVSMVRLADMLGSSPAAGRLVLDRTGITGEFNIDVQFAPSNLAFLATVERETGARASFAGPSLFTALEEQLGLRLEETTASVEFWVIERVQKPSEN